MNVLITGVGGQAGSYLAELLLNNGYRVIGVVRRNSTSDSHWRIKNILDHKNFILEVGDVTDPCYFFPCLRKYKPEIIYNAAAQSHVHISFSQPSYTWDVVAKGCLNLLESIRFLREELPSYNPHFIQFSSSEMFGSNYTQVGDDHVQNLDTAFSPNSPYSIAKLAAHNYCILYRKAYSMNISPVILFNYESPRRGEQFVTKKITSWLANLKYHIEKYGNPSINTNLLIFKDKESNIIVLPKLKLGNIESVRDWGHCLDYMRAMVKIGESEPGDYILSTGQIYTVANFLYMGLKYIGIEKDLTEYYLIDKDLFRPLEVGYLKGDCKSTRLKLKWSPQITVDTLIKEMIDFDYEKIRK